jgi:hypothetical protein
MNRWATITDNGVECQRQNVMPEYQYFGATSLACVWSCAPWWENNVQVYRTVVLWFSKNPDGIWQSPMVGAAISCTP